MEKIERLVWYSPEALDILKRELLECSPLIAHLLATGMPPVGRPHGKD